MSSIADALAPPFHADSPTAFSSQNQWTSSSLPWTPAIFVPEPSLAARLPDYVASQLEPLRARLRTHGAVLLRGFAPSEPAAFAEAAAVLGGPLGGDYEGPSPRLPLAPGVYTASEVWSALTIAEHAEMSYLPAMPRTLFFWCRRAALHGGATTLVNARRVLARLDPATIAPLLQQPLRIRRRHRRHRWSRDPFELKPWPQLFGTDRPELARGRAEALGYEVHFDAEGALTLVSEQPALRHHPDTGEAGWLNHLLVFHASAPSATLRDAVRTGRSLPAALLTPVADAYRALCRHTAHPTASDVTLADDTPIPDDVVAHIRAAVIAETYPLAWQTGDLAIVDNHSVLHGRQPFRGPREVIVAWSAARA